MSRPWYASGLLLSAWLAGCADPVAERAGGSRDGEVARPAPEQQAAQHLSAGRLRRATRSLPPGTLSRSTQGLAHSIDEDGIVKLHLAGRFQHASVAAIGSDGRAHTTCIDGSPPDAGEDPADE